MTEQVTDVIHAIIERFGFLVMSTPCVYKIGECLPAHPLRCIEGEQPIRVPIKIEAVSTRAEFNRQVAFAKTFGSIRIPHGNLTNLNYYKIVALD